jgi:hypothetical protein
MGGEVKLAAGMRARRTLCMWLLVSLAALVWTSPALAAFPGRNGKIAFEATGPRIWTMNPDNTDRTQLTAFGFDPKWSPDGTKILFWGPGPSVINADGTGLTRIRDYGLWPSWSPDGKMIVFTEDDLTRGLWVMNADGTDATQITQGPYDVEAVWSPDGSRIAFMRLSGDQPGLYVMSADPFGPPSLLVEGQFAGAGDPDWSPDSRAIAFTQRPNIRIWDQGSLRETEASLAESPAWSPDGSKIAYAGPGRDSFGDLFTMDVDGTNPVDITNTLVATTAGGEELSPDWQPLPNRPPDCAGVIAIPGSLHPASKGFRRVTLRGATDPEGDAVDLTVTGVTQDEPVRAQGDHTAPDAKEARRPDLVYLRAERNPRGDGRVYRIAFEASDVEGATCTGIARVEVRRHPHSAAIESPASYDSFDR